MVKGVSYNRFIEIMVDEIVNKLDGSHDDFMNS